MSHIVSIDERLKATCETKFVRPGKVTVRTEFLIGVLDAIKVGEFIVLA
jgi:hypothetical protein